MLGRNRQPQQPPQLVNPIALQAMDVASMTKHSLHQETDADYDDRIQREGLVKFVKFLVEDKSIPTGMNEHFWALTDKEITLTNLNPNTDRILRRRATILINQYLMSVPQYKITPEMIIQLQNLVTKWDIKRSRATNGFERIAQVTQIRENTLDLKAQQKNPGALKRATMGMIGR